jgi:hypothetical protein
MPKKPMTVTDAYNKAKPKGKTSARENVTKSGQGSGNTMSRSSVGAARNAVTKTGMGSGNMSAKKKGKSFFDRVGDVAKGVGRVGSAVVKDSVNTVTNPFGAAKSTAKQIGRDVKNKNVAGLGLAAASMIPIPGAKGTAAAIKAAGKAGKATKTLSQLADDAVKAGAKGAKGSKPKPTPKPKTKPTPKPSSKPPATPKPKTKVESAQSELADVRKELADFKAAKGGKYKDDIGYKRLNEKLRAKEQKVANAVKEAATPPREQRGVTQKTMTDTPVKPGDAQRTYSGVGRSKTPRTGVTESPKPNKGQYEGDTLRGQARNDAASMSNKGLRGSSRATRDGRTAENKAKNVENIKIRENDRKVAKYNDMLAKAKASKKPKDIAAAKKYADFWKLKGIKKLK